jgi:hypothetical protein
MEQTEVSFVDMDVMSMSKDALITQLAHTIETSDGWMSAYYRQTSRLLRAESALRDVIDGLRTQKGFERTIAAINETLEEIKQ